MTDVKTAACPTDKVLAGWLEELAEDGERAEFAAHLADCDACRRRLEQLAAGDETFGRVLDGVRGGAAVAAGVAPPLAAVIKSLKNRAAFVEPTLGPELSPDLPAGFLQPEKDPSSGRLGRVGDYEVAAEIGRGAMGVVLRAFDPKLQRVVALKVMSPHLAAFPLARRRFVREGHSAAAVCHENVVTIHAVDESAGLPYLVMQYVSGKTLQQRLDQGAPFTVAEILRIGRQAAAGLAAAHAQGLVHRDIKPANLLLENGVQRVKLTDFGLARAVDDASLTQTGVISGTPQYMAPEQARGEALDGRADLFSLGCVLYAMCTGRPPFRATGTLAVLKRICEDQPRAIRELNPDIPDWLDAIIRKLLEKRREDRYPSAAALGDLLGDCLCHVRQPTVVGLPAALGPLVEKTPPPPADLGPGSLTTGRRWWASTRGLAALTAAAVLPLLAALTFHEIDRRFGLNRPPEDSTRSSATERRPTPSRSRATIDEEVAKADAFLHAEERQLLQQAVRDSEKRLALVRTKYAAGTVPSSDVLAVECEQHRAVAKLCEACGERKKQREALRQLVAVLDKRCELARELATAQKLSEQEVLAVERELTEAKLELLRAERP